MIRASGEWFWLIVIAFVAISKLLSKFQSASQDDDAPAAPPKPRPKRPPRSRPQPIGQAKPPPKIKREWEAAPEQIRRFLEQLEEQQAPAPPPVAAVPSPTWEPPSAPRPATKAPPAPKPPPPPPPPRAPMAPPEPTRASVWADALRDRGNLRNIIISAEIIGPPKALSSWQR